MPASDPTADGANSQPAKTAQNDAVELIRHKITDLYTKEPAANQEAAEAEAVKVRSKHQQYMHELSTSGKSLAEIQTAWHNYYVGLPDDEKHQVWREFYANHNKALGAHTEQQAQTEHPTAQTTQSASHRPKTAADVKRQLLGKVQNRSRLSIKHRHQLKSLGFGLSMGFLVLVIMLFSFFNERFIAPFMRPSYTISSTPIITDVTATEATVSPNPVVIIPKINIEIPVVYDEPSIDEAAVQRALERGVLHYATTSNPGEQGNAVFFGHSSSNIFNNGKYKFAFVLLNRLDNGDTFMLQKDGKRYVYRVFEKKVVPPTEVSVLNSRDKPTATLITCDPPGTDLNRLVIVGEQISPDPTTNVASTAPTDNVSSPEALPSEAPTLWGRLWSWLGS